MRDLILEKVRDAAGLLGLPREHVMTKSYQDNLTLPRPRVELDFLPETYRRTGRGLGTIKLSEDHLKIKKETYEIDLPVVAQILAKDPEWLKESCYRLAAALPRSFDDRHGNHVTLQATQGEWEDFNVRRVGVKEIDPIKKRGYLLHIRVTWRMTSEQLIEKVSGIDLKVGGF